MVDQARIRDLFFKGMNTVHQAVFSASGGKLAGKFMGMPALRLTTTGRKSGQPRSTMLTAPIVDGDNVVLVASKGGDPRHPAWFLNLRENPEVKVLMEGRERTMRARVAEGAEREALWSRLTADHSNYADYQENTDRQIPVVVCEPVG